ncbi:S8 family serine peptidase [Streptomyces sp. DSM 40750]|uniref:S8 family serine peptidase n=1 Tax=Streptomyces sp. DSM 40750 TaxID=2801030 RepID=UPI0027D45004|nr:S8 family serine peptidase [Streptomyces sp. DSM 40750]
MRNRHGNQHRLRTRGKAAAYGGAVALTMVVGLTATLQATGAPSAAAEPRSALSATARITLVTGDTVDVDRGGRVVGVEMGKGRSRTGYVTRHIGGHTHVVPVDAIKLLNSGRLDRRLFDITQLVKDGYDDEHQKRLPLIVSYRGGQDQRADAEQALAAADADVERRLPAVRGQSLVTDKQDAPQVWKALTNADSRAEGAVTTAPGVDRVWLDARVRAVPRTAADAPADGTGPTRIGAPDAWRAGWTGKGVKVAVLDTGIDATHPDLKGRVVAAKDFSASGNTDDKAGHGTHVASTIAGSGTASAGKYRGVAPDARLLNGKVLGDDGSGEESGIIAGMQWAVQQGAKVINMSLGGTDTPGADPMEKAVNTLSASKGVLFAIAAGNEGPAEATVGSPGSAAAAITVAAVDRQDSLARFSSRGPTADDGLKPDLSAPGVDIVAARAKHGAIGEDADIKGYTTMSGTSMATPHVAGAAAILAQRHPDWNGTRIKAALMGSAKANTRLTAYEQGSGRVDAARAVTQTVVTEPASLAFGTQAWPHDDDTPITRTLAYRNTGTAPVTLSLEADGPAGVFTLTPARLTVPAGGTATATATADTRAVKDGVHSGAMIATTGDGTTVVRTPALVNREIESYNVTVKSVGVDGKAADWAMASLVGLDSPRSYDPYLRDADGDYQVTLRVPKGRYAADVFLTGGRRNQQSVLVAPNLRITKDTTLAFDQRRAKKVRITAPEQGAAGIAQVVQYAVHGSKKEYAYAAAFPGDGTTLAQVGPSASAKDFMAQIGTVLGARAAGKPQYNIVVSRQGSFFTGLTQAVRRSSMAKVDMAIGATVKDTQALQTAQWEVPGFPQLTGGGPGLKGFSRPAPTSRRVIYVSADHGLRWNLGLDLHVGGDSFPYSQVMGLGAKRYEPGRSYREGWNQGVFGPVAARGTVPIGGYRSGNGYTLCNPLFSDGRLVLDRNAKQKTVLTAGGRTYLSTTTDPCSFAYPLDGLAKERTRYTLTGEATRSLNTYKVSDRVSAKWTFTSQYVDPTRVAERLPLSAVRFLPKLSLTATAKAGRKITVPVVVQGPAAVKGHLKSLAVQVSYDGGRTWKPVTVRTDTAGKRSLRLVHPQAPGTVSLKASLSDTEGNTYTGTIGNAYRTVR